MIKHDLYVSLDTFYKSWRIRSIYNLTCSRRVTGEPITIFIKVICFLKGHEGIFHSLNLRGWMF